MGIAYPRREGREREGVQNEDIRFYRSAIEWRRNYILQRLSEGWSQSEIAKKLELHPSTISLDCQYLRLQSQSNLKEHDKHIPEIYQRCEIGLNQILRRVYDISNDPNITTTERLSSLNSMANIYAKIMELSTDGKILNQLLSEIKRVKEELESKEQEQETEIDDCAAIEQEQKQEENTN